MIGILGTNWDASNPAPVAELRPPPEHEGKPLHWVQRSSVWGWNIDGREVVRWVDGCWFTLASDLPLTSAEAANLGWRYLGPAEWDAHGKGAVQGALMIGEAASERIEQLESQLPEGMKHCTILFKECDKGHGWLTATNWHPHGCPTCRAEHAEAQAKTWREETMRHAATLAEVRAENASLRGKIKRFLDTLAPPEMLAKARALIEGRSAATTAVDPADGHGASGTETPNDRGRQTGHVAVRQGEFITCDGPDHHLICEVTETIRYGETGWTVKLGAWRLENPPVVGEKLPPCPCGATWVRAPNQLHVKGRGWV